jgi:4,5-dihydroxyphthalate decarboxylase
MPALADQLILPARPPPRPRAIRLARIARGPPRSRADPIPGRGPHLIMTAKTKLLTLLADYPNTLALKRGEIRSELVDLEFADIKIANTGFKSVVRDAKFDLAELAIVTYLQAKAYGKPYILLPAPVVARSQHHTIAYNRERGHLEPADLVGKRVGVRAYSVTTGVWVRGILQEQFGVDIDKVHWVTFEDPHVAEYSDPPTAERAPSGKNLVQMLIDGELDAAIVGDKFPDTRLEQLIPDAEAAASAWAEKHGAPINHMAVIRTEISGTRPDIVRDVFRMLKESRDVAARDGDERSAQLQFGIEANRIALESIIDIALRQKLIPRKWRVEELFDDVTRGLA